MEYYKEELQKAWAEVGLDLAKWLAESMLNKIQAVIKARGGHTKY